MLRPYDELLTGELPYNVVKPPLAIINKVYEGVSPRGLTGKLRYNLPCVDQVWGLLEACWQDASLRPSISDVKERMRRFYLQKMGH